MSLSNFIPTIWSGTLLTALERKLVYAQAGVVNTDYEGEIQDGGDAVKINSVGDPTISDYVRNTTIGLPEELLTAQQTLLIDKMHSFNFFVDDVDKVQSKIDPMSQVMDRAAWGLKNKVDTKVSTDMKDATPTVNKLGSTGSPKTISAATDVYNYIVDLGALLDAADVPDSNRWIILPPWLISYMKKDTRFGGSGAAAADSRLLNGIFDRVNGFNILTSNTVQYSSTTWYIQAGTADAYTIAYQIAKVEAYRHPEFFSDAVKGLLVYGGKVIRPECLAQLVITKP